MAAILCEITEARERIILRLKALLVVEPVNPLIKLLLDSIAVCGNYLRSRLGLGGIVT